MTVLQDSLDRAEQLVSERAWTGAVEMYVSIRQQDPEKEAATVAFGLGHAYFHLGKLSEAASEFEKAVQLRPDFAPWRYRLAFVESEQGNLTAAISNYKAALSMEPHRTRWADRLRTAVERHAAAELEAATSSPQPNDPAYHSSRLRDFRTKKGQRWQELQMLEAGLHLHLEDAAWLAELGEANYQMKRFDQSAKHYAAASRLSGDNPEWHFREGHSLEKLGELHAARQAYQKAIATDEKLKADILGIGVFFQKKGMWTEALAHYLEAANADPLNAELSYRIGLSHDRSYRWADAAHAYERAILLNPEVGYWHYKLGFVRERQSQWLEAAAAYNYAYSLDPSKKYWAYRAGYSLQAGGRYEGACEAYLRSSPIALTANDPALEQTDADKNSYLAGILRALDSELNVSQHADFHSRAGDLALQASHWQSARTEFQKAMERSNPFDSSLYYKAGFAAYQSGDFEKACAAFKQAKVFQFSDGIKVEKYLANESQKKSMEFVEYLETLPLRDDVILWESNHGSSIGCHPLALFDHVDSDSAFQSFTHYWVINNDVNIPERLKSRSDVIFVETNSDLYKRILASAKYLVNNVSFPPYYTRRPGQQYLNTWHGTPLKTLGKDMRGAPLAHANIARNFLQATHLMSPNEHTSQALIERHDIAGVFQGKIAVTGSPRIDVLTNADASRRDQIRRELGIPDNDSKPVVLYAPTWRGATNDRTVDALELAADLEAMRSPEHHLLFRAHRLTEGLLTEFDAGASVVPGHIDTNELLLAVDVLITDYSSIFFDFLPTGRPIVFYTHDLEEYSAERGLYLDVHDMPGRVVIERGGLPSAIQAAADAPGFGHPAYNEALKRFCPKEDGGAAARVRRFFFEDDPDGLAAQRADDKTSILFHHGLIPNGIATSFYNLVSSLAPEQYRVVLIVEPHVLAADPARLGKFRELPEHVQVIGRVGVHALTPEEKWILGRYTAHFDLSSDEQRAIYRKSFRREFQRILGPAAFDSNIEFDGYATFWSSLIAYGSPNGHKSIYLHNDMASELDMKFPNLEALFRLYESFDSLISVSASVSDENRSGLADRFGLPREKFVSCDNQIFPEAVITAAAQELDPDILHWYESAARNYLAIGRLSPEKDHAKLIRAFVRFHQRNPDTNLLILGDGPLRADLEHLVTKLGATSFVWLAGQRQNPYPALQAASCFVLPSLHEGQPMVLFEALILGLNIVCTDMPGPRDVLQGRYGLIVTNDEGGLVEGLQAAQDGLIPEAVFDAEDYTKSALAQFLKANVPVATAPELSVRG
ncbi:CDP-glycerol glycerophosphotransferase family protein [Arthrobacter sp. ov118]|uniref:CDP-glycerol glycerophosphotransferase family protein n=1 Tax=Arthrobacter sp. ov118 TaxID=1761747 RepID=UPI0008E4480D|nr:CDP-glycerol glycerophosphotransferase family protein [Arthrobacter sp. ov118]SFT65747.1 CDP-glycerol glycerophosphotransferase [Arthrobacter sp. ov118]